MSKKERDKWDDAIRSKFDDFEMDTMPGDWEAIADRLPGKAPVPLRRTFRYWVAAAVISLLVVSSGIYLYDQDMRNVPVASEIKRQNEAIKSQIKDSQIPAPVLAAEPDELKKEQRGTAGIAVARGKHLAASQPMLRSAIASRIIPEELDGSPSADDSVSVIDEQAEVMNEVAEAKEATVITKANTFVADAAPVERRKSKKVSPRKWGFGMGGGGFSMGADNLVPQYVTNSSMFKSENLVFLNSFKENEQKTDIHHKTPIGLGISISRYLNSRFALQTGLTYSYLRSEWSTSGGAYHIENDQRLHFIGIPLSLTYKIAEWNRFMFYASAGGMTEVNVAGKRRMKLFSDDNEIISQSEKARMKEWLWSVNARVGVSYPIIRFVSAFAEVGAGYYFDNGSEIETIHSEKPFNVNLQFGFRFGF